MLSEATEIGWKSPYIVESWKESGRQEVNFNGNEKRCFGRQLLDKELLRGPKEARIKMLNKFRQNFTVNKFLSQVSSKEDAFKEVLKASLSIKDYFARRLT